MSPSELDLEKYLLGELDEHSMAKISDALLNSPELQKRLESLRESNEIILKKYPSALMSKRIHYKLDSAQARVPSSRGWLRKIMVMAPAPAMVLLVALALPSLRSSRSQGQPESAPLGAERIKGLSTSLQIYRKRGSALEKMANGELAKAHDLIQLSYSVDRERYGAVLSVDGRRQVTLHFPEKVGEAPLLEMGREVVLPSAFELDESPEYEAFVLVTSEKPFNVEHVVAAAKRGTFNAGTGRFEMELRLGSVGNEQDAHVYVTMLRK
ncbi:MAG: hypothetical protein A2428_02610 [Bdellovibrionales bacterium RIFOXYC1_FULL_54_43]|nr:MAG: hypothetical protein A2428_02610 [Bdellovibrionales bacterium RIFOXYC1_FULL_54_43]OFZ82578.1 MAG: hypothetical protein A2603_15065 [Bdellovibrionales bacterium RIFOXYD1_FULL_55_31]